MTFTPDHIPSRWWEDSSWRGRSPASPGPSQTPCATSCGTGAGQLPEGGDLPEVTSLTPFGELSTGKKIILRRNLHWLRVSNPLVSEAGPCLGILFITSARYLVFSDFTLRGMAGICHTGEVRQSVSQWCPWALA